MPRKRNSSPQTIRLLAAFLKDPGTWRYGYDLSQETGLKSGTLYPLLMRLSDQGLLEDEWMKSTKMGRPPRHVYRLTRNGISLATSLLDESPITRGRLYAEGA